MVERIARVLVKMDDKFLEKCAEDGVPYMDIEWIQRIDNQLGYRINYDKVKYEFIEFEPQEDDSP